MKNINIPIINSNCAFPELDETEGNNETLLRKKRIEWNDYSAFKTEVPKLKMKEFVYVRL